MPAPYATLAQLIDQARTLHTEPLAHILDTAQRHNWNPAHTVEVLNAARHATDTHPVAIAQAFARELDLADTVASYITTLDTYQQTGDPAEAEALENLEAHMRHLTGLDDQPDNDTDTP
jgi:hypothetical protein